MLRSLTRLLVVLLPIAIVIPVLGVVSADAAAPTRTVSAIAGEPVAFAGTTPRKVKRPLVVQQLVGKTWRTVQKERTDKAGRYRFELRARAATYRVLAPRVRVGRERLPAWTSPSTTVRLLSQGATMTVPITARAGSNVPVQASLTPVRVGRPVALQALRPSGWVNVATTTQTSSPQVSFAVNPTKTTTYRVAALAWKGAALNGTKPASVVVAPRLAEHEPWVTGYYAGWFWDQGYDPTKVDVTAMTHVVFGRVAPGGGSLGGTLGEVVEGAGTAHDPGTAPGGGSVEDYLIDKAHAAGTQALLMLGGDGADGLGFLHSATDQKRSAFVENVVDYLVAHDYDGVDLDWENCLSGPQSCDDKTVSATEAQRRLVALIDDLRVEMATRQRYATTPGLVTFPGYAVKINEIVDGKVEQWQADVANKSDQYNLMSYGVGTTWNGGGWLSWFSGALFGAGGSNPVDISSSVDAYVATGVPRDRIGAGIGFYGIYFGPSITGPRQPTDGNNIYEVYDPAMSYAVLDDLGYFDHGTRHWDDEAKSTYRVYTDGGYVPAGEPTRSAAGFLSYEDEQSIAAKGEWVRETGVGGAMIWTINYGWLPGSQTNPLLDAVKESFLED